MSVYTNALLDCSLLDFAKREKFPINKIIKKTPTRFDNIVFFLGNQGLFSTMELMWVLIEWQILSQTSCWTLRKENQNSSLRTQLPFLALPITALGNSKFYIAQRASYLEVLLITLSCSRLGIREERYWRNNIALCRQTPTAMEPYIKMEVCHWALANAKLDKALKDSASTPWLL